VVASYSTHFLFVFMAARFVEGDYVQREIDEVKGMCSLVDVLMFAPVHGCMFV
jgi:hypothetical protein